MTKVRSSEERSGRGIDFGSRISIPVLERFITPHNIVDQVIHEQQSVCIKADQTVAHGYRDEHERLTHSTRIIFCALFDPFLNLWLHLAALLRNLLHEKCQNDQLPK